MKSTIQAAFTQVVQKPWLLFLCFWLLLVFLCLPAYNAGFNRDFEGLLYYFHSSSFLDFINRAGFSIKSLYQITQLQLFAFISLWGTNPLLWFVLLTGLHAANATLIFVFSKRWFVDFQLPNALLIAFLGALLFLVNPSITEVTIWKGGYHYLIAILSQTLLLLFTQSYLKTQEKKYIAFTVLLFLLTSFTLELFYLSPWYCLFLLLAYYWRGLVSKQNFNEAVLKIFLPQILLFVAHLSLFRYCYGSWVAHYGTTGGLHFDAEVLLPRLPKYLATLLIFTAHSTREFASSIYSFCEQPVFYYSFFILLVIAVIFIFVSYKKMNSSLQIASVFFGMMLLCAVIILPVHFDNGMQIYNSRFCYQLSIPVYMLLCLFTFLLLRKKEIATIILLLYATVGMGFAFRKANDWRQASKVQNALLNSYKWQNEKQVLVLNLPCYYNDICIIPSGDNDEFQEHLLVFGHDTCKYPAQFVSSYNMNTEWDGAHIVLQDSVTIKVTLNQWGSWWMYNLAGAMDRETKNYKLEMRDVGHEYILHLKKPAKNFIILYQKGNQWQVVDNSKLGENAQW